MEARGPPPQNYGVLFLPGSLRRRGGKCRTAEQSNSRSRPVKRSIIGSLLRRTAFPKVYAQTSLMRYFPGMRINCGGKSWNQANGLFRANPPTEWRADKAGMQVRGVTEKSYVEQCKAGGVMPSVSAPEPKPTVAAPTLAPEPARTNRDASCSSNYRSRRPTTTTAAPAPRPAQQPSASNSGATLEAGQFADDASAKARCPTDTVVWVNLPSKIYHFAGTKSYGTTKRGEYMCEKEAIVGENPASKTEKHP